MNTNDVSMLIDIICRLAVDLATAAGHGDEGNPDPSVAWALADWPEHHAAYLRALASLERRR